MPVRRCAGLTIHLALWNVILSSAESPFGKHEAISIGHQVLGNDSESEGTQGALAEVLADHSTDG